MNRTVWFWGKTIAQIHVEVFAWEGGEEVPPYDRFDELPRKSIEV